MIQSRRTWLYAGFLTTRDPTSHNLWPFEVVIALMVGFSCSLGGVVATTMGAMLRAPQPAERPS